MTTKLERQGRMSLQLSAFGIKLIALVTMTIDHLGAYQTLTYDGAVNGALRVIGRIAAPLFLFMVVEGLRHTRSKGRYILRLYLAGLAMESVNRVLERLTGCMDIDNTLPMLFYTALFAFCAEILCGRRGGVKAKFLAACGLTVPFLFYALHVVLTENGSLSVWNALSLFFPSPMNVSYSMLFVLMGVAWYLIDNKAVSCAILAALSLASFAVPPSLFFTASTAWLSPVFVSAFGVFIDPQWCMCLAIPFILLYNGKKGRGMKALFYLYYPLHVYLLLFIQLFKNRLG